MANTGTDGPSVTEAGGFSLLLGMEELPLKLLHDHPVAAQARIKT
jgi:hypothetical protein